jgi:hypothetical protein
MDAVLEQGGHIVGGVLDVFEIVQHDQCMGRAGSGRTTAEARFGPALRPDRRPARASAARVTDRTVAPGPRTTRRPGTRPAFPRRLRGRAAFCPIHRSRSASPSGRHPRVSKARTAATSAARPYKLRPTGGQVVLSDSVRRTGKSSAKPGARS